MRLSLAKFVAELGKPKARFENLVLGLREAFQIRFFPSSSLRSFTVEIVICALDRPKREPLRVRVQLDAE